MGFQGYYQYHVEFKSEIEIPPDAHRLRIGLLSEFLNRIGNGADFDGQTLFTKNKLEEDV
jgi:hypothetical protein